VETEGPQMASQYGAYALNAGLAKVHARMRTPTRQYTHMHASTHRSISNTYYFSIATMVTRTRLNITYTYVACLVPGVVCLQFLIIVLVICILPIPVAERSQARVCSLSLAGIMRSNPAEGMDICFLWMLCVCQVEVSATGRSVIHRSPTDCGVI
jgi:hypothetical protein